MKKYEGQLVRAVKIFMCLMIIIGAMMLEYDEKVFKGFIDKEVLKALQIQKEMLFDRIPFVFVQAGCSNPIATTECSNTGTPNGKIILEKGTADSTTTILLNT